MEWLFLRCKSGTIKSLNYYQLLRLFWPWIDLVPGTWVHSMHALLLCNALIRWQIGSSTITMQCTYSMANRIDRELLRVEWLS